MAETPRLLFLVRVLQLEIYNRMVQRLAEHGLTPAQYMLLTLVSRHENSSNADLARRARTTPQSMNETIATLERSKLLARRESPDHRRILHVRLTAAGTRLVERCEGVIDDIEREIFGTFSAKELAGFRDALGRALANCRAAEISEAP